MDAYKEFKRAYRKYFLDNTDYLSSKLICSIEDIPTEDESYKNALIQAYVFLSTCKSRDVAHLKMLVNYEKLMKKNRESGMNVNAVNFATMLYILHHYCVRVLRCPWRKDFFTIKAYNGFYQYTLRKCLSPPLIKELLLMLGFEFDTATDAFGLDIPRHDRSSIRTITEAGIGFFLSYTHCMAKNDPQFKKNITALSYLLKDPARNDTMANLQAHSIPNRPGTSGLSEYNSRTYGGGFSQSSARERRREKRNIYGNDRPISQQPDPVEPRSNLSSAADIYGAQEGPVDLSVKNRLHYGHKDEGHSISSRGSSHSDYVDDQVLYGTNASTSNYFTTHDRNSSMENSINDRVLYPPLHPNFSPPPHSSYNLDSQMENCRFDDKPRDLGYLARPKVVEKRSRDPEFRSRNVAANDVNYVKLFPHTSAADRGSPDGQITTEAYVDHASAKKRTSPSKESRQSARSATHIYHEINDRDLYG